MMTQAQINAEYSSLCTRFADLTFKVRDAQAEIAAIEARVTELKRMPAAPEAPVASEQPPVTAGDIVPAEVLA